MYIEKVNVLFYPDIPDPRYTIRRILDRAGVESVNEPKDDFNAAIAWKDETYFFPDDILLELEYIKPVFNLACVDISKRMVNENFKNCFGYPLAPENLDRPIVVKNNLNAFHDGVIIYPNADGVQNAVGDQNFEPLHFEPLRYHPDRVFQYYILTLENGFFIDYRTYIFGLEISLVKKKYKSGIFDNNPHHVDILTPNEVFNRDEQDKILLFARGINMDVGELDILRDKNGKIYIVDANKTPWLGIPALPPERAEKALDYLTEGFFKMIA